MDNTNHLVVRKQVEINLSISSSDTTTVAVMEMPLKKVELQADVYMVCLQHALSTENFEVMGLLIGNLESGVANISAVKILRRSDKKKDRVEISSEQVLKAAAEAERLTVKLKRPMRVLGWYHSHPHITVWPSHVDVRTQATYQTMDHGFVGLIFSVFSEGKDSKEQEALVTCFQSHNGEATEIPLEIQYTPVLSEHCLKTMTELPKILVQEEEDSAETCKDHPDLLATIHNNAVHTKALAHITDIITRPLLSTFEKRLALNKMRIIYLQRQLEELQEIHIKSMNDSWSE
ncbi:lys-63-specific deubiquitinase BRCC36-like isoform X2 [Athalia rosae]|nr:lys-63-specific deubiquitinase BRCC36-like isoform X2 [Athalia rosae]XP_048505005.1 lys-63-specific deubiquitinase BRCC36-like isoform X2 [Athalia rosae]